MLPKPSLAKMLDFRIDRVVAIIEQHYLHAKGKNCAVQSTREDYKYVIQDVAHLH